MTTEAPIKVCQFMEIHGVKSGRMTAILHAMYPEEKRVKYVVASKVLQFMRAYPNLTIRQLKQMAEEKLSQSAA